MIGTFDYMSPEQMVGGMCTGRSDIYTLGVVMFEMISGERPFGEVNGPTGLLAAMLTKPPPRLASHADVPSELDQLVARCLEREQQVRVQSIEELAAALDELLHDEVGDAVTRIVPAIEASDSASHSAPFDAGSSGTRATTLRDGGVRRTATTTVPTAKPPPHSRDAQGDAHSGPGGASPGTPSVSPLAGPWPPARLRRRSR